MQTEQQIALQVSGLRCQSCALRVEQALQKLPSVTAVAVSFASETASITWRASAEQPEPPLDEWMATIQRAGYGARVRDESLEQRDVSYRLPWHLWGLLALALPFVLAMVLMPLGIHAMPPVTVQALLAWGVQSAFALPFYRGAWHAARARSANMDTLVALGTSVTLLYSTWAWLSGHEAVYFEASVMVVAFVRIGKYWEEVSKRSSLNALSLLLRLRPRQVCRLDGESALWIDASAVQLGDVLRVRAGERVGADGLVLSGEGRCDESHLTGEPELRSKRRGEPVLAGALVVEGSLTYSVSRVGKETLLGDLLQALEQAQNSKAPIARIADRVAAWFVPLVVVLALLSFAGSYHLGLESALVRLAAVLVVACPCALGLATPASMMVGLGRAVAQGVWFRDGAALEQTAAVDTVVLDKTGTLTVGRPQVVGMWLAESAYTRAQLLQYAASVEVHAQHPLAGAIVAYAQCEDLLPIAHLQQQTGAGITAQVDGKTVQLGSAAFVDVALPEGAIAAGQSAVLMTVDKALCAVFALADDVKEDAQSAVRDLQALGVQLWILSGDRAAAVEVVAQRLGIEHYAGEQSPRAKAERIKALRAQGATVAMVGDGVNDVAALSEADCGMAFYSGAEVASHVASVRLMQHEMRQVWASIKLARLTLRNIRQNLWLAFLYNALMLPLAALGYLTPALAGSAMALSSVAVLLNALRLKRMV